MSSRCSSSWTRWASWSWWSRCCSWTCWLTCSWAGCSSSTCSTRDCCSAWSSGGSSARRRGQRRLVGGVELLRGADEGLHQRRDLLAADGGAGELAERVEEARERAEGRLQGGVLGGERRRVEAGERRGDEAQVGVDDPGHHRSQHRERHLVGRGEAGDPPVERVHLVGEQRRDERRERVGVVGPVRRGAQRREELLDAREGRRAADGRRRERVREVGELDARAVAEERLDVGEGGERRHAWREGDPAEGDVDGQRVAGERELRAAPGRSPLASATIAAMT